MRALEYTQPQRHRGEFIADTTPFPDGLSAGGRSTGSTGAARSPGVSAAGARGSPPAWVSSGPAFGHPFGVPSRGRGCVGTEPHQQQRKRLFAGDGAPASCSAAVFVCGADAASACVAPGVLPAGAAAFGGCADWRARGGQRMAGAGAVRAGVVVRKQFAGVRAVPTSVSRGCAGGGFGYIADVA